MVIVTKEENALSNHMISLEGVSHCSHEEADTQICVHVRHSAQDGSKSLLVKASDTYILVIAISVMATLQAIGLQQLWIAFGQGRNMRLIPAHELYRSIGHEKGRSLHSFMPSLVVMWSQPSVAKERNLRGRPGTCVLMLLMYLLDSAITPQVASLNDNEVDILERRLIWL